jgi:hypothetical protein
MNCGTCGAVQPDWAGSCGQCGAELTDEIQQGPAGPPLPAATAYPPPRRRRPGAMAAVAAVVVVLGALVLAGWQQHWPPGVFGRGAQPLAWRVAEAPLPADAAPADSQFAGLNDVACSGAGNCVGVGYYVSGTDHSTRGLVETLSHGTWTPSTLPDPTTGQGAFFDLDGIACPKEGTCVAVGGWFDPKHAGGPVIDTLSKGTWASAGVPLPGDADWGKSAFLSQVACPAPGRCVAVGWYTDQDGHGRAMIDTLSGGTWASAKAPLPAGAAPRAVTSSTLPTALLVVKCPAAGSCVAAGDYTDENGAGQGLIDTLSGGTWTAARAPLPGGAAASPTAYLWALTCPARGACVAVGHYTGRQGQSQGLIESQSGGTWSPATASLPAGAAANQEWSESQPIGLSMAACPAAGTCVAGGSYIARNGSVAGLIDTLSGGTWTARRAPLPADAAAAKQDVFLGSATCPAVGDCVAVGSYKTRGGGNQGLIETAKPAG